MYGICFKTITVTFKLIIIGSWLLAGLEVGVWLPVGWFLVVLYGGRCHCLLASEPRAAEARASMHSLGHGCPEQREKDGELG